MESGHELQVTKSQGYFFISCKSLQVQLSQPILFEGDHEDSWPQRKVERIVKGVCKLQKLVSYLENWIAFIWETFPRERGKVGCLMGYPKRCNPKYKKQRIIFIPSSNFWGRISWGAGELGQGGNCTSELKRTLEDLLNHLYYFSWHSQKKSISASSSLISQIKTSTKG